MTMTHHCHSRASVAKAGSQRGTVSIARPCSSQSLPLAKAGGQALGPRFCVVSAGVTIVPAVCVITNGAAMLHQLTP